MDNLNYSYMCPRRDFAIVPYGYHKDFQRRYSLGRENNKYQQCICPINMHTQIPREFNHYSNRYRAEEYNNSPVNHRPPRVNKLYLNIFYITIHRTIITSDI